MFLFLTAILIHELGHVLAAGLCHVPFRGIRFWGTGIEMAFDFSSCKIYDQGLIYLLNELTKNEKITWVNLRENFFSHEIDFVILNFLEKNTKITHFDLKKNRFSFQCLQKVDKIIKRNKKIQNNKEPNRLLVELYSLKYENTKLNELKDTLKGIENDNEKLKLNKKDLRQDYENFKEDCETKVTKMKEAIEKNNYLLNLRKKELQEKTESLEQIKKENAEVIEQLTKQYEELRAKKDKLTEDNENLKKNAEQMEKEFIKEINMLNDEIDINKKKEADFMKEVKNLADEIVKIDKLIKGKQKE
jgi:chromosome segregation ATPase